MSNAAQYCDRRSSRIGLAEQTETRDLNAFGKIENAVTIPTWWNNEVRLSFNP